MIVLHAFYQLVAVAVGLVFGSFWNVAISRWPDDRSVVAPRSACPSCGTPVAAIDNIPLLSWFILRGRCRSCSWPIPATYPLTELLGGMLGFLVYRRFIPTPADLDLPHVAAACLYFAFASALVIGAFVDVRHKILPDQVTVFMIPVGMLGAGALQLLGYTDWLGIGYQASAVGTLVGGAFFGTIALVAWAMTGREALGIGDVKLLAMIGAFLGPHPAIYVVSMAASLTGAFANGIVMLLQRRRAYTPFGPFLAFWAMVYLLYADVLLARFFPMLALSTGLVDAVSSPF